MNDHKIRTSTWIMKCPFFITLFFTGSIAPAAAYEVWLTDQSDTGKETGGFLYIYDGAQLAANATAAKPTQTIDFSGDIGKFCEEATKKPVRRPHMLFFNAKQDHAIISFLSGHVLFMDAATKKPDACLSMGKNVHAAWPTPDQKMANAANIAEKKFIRIWTDYAAHKFGFDPEKDVMNLGAMESGERPDTSPICPITESSSKYAFVTLRGGGLLVVDVTATPMKVVATLDNNQVHPAGCGGIESGGTMYINSGGGWPIAPLSLRPARGASSANAPPLDPPACVQPPRLRPSPGQPPPTASAHRTAVEGHHGPAAPTGRPPPPGGPAFPQPAPCASAGGWSVPGECRRRKLIADR